MNTEAYLQRINYSGSVLPTAETLRDLQAAHLLTVPFENLSIHEGEPIVLEDEALFHKIVGRKRGGFCYECNGLFGALLRALGFDVVMLSAGVAKEEGGFGPEFDHLALLVTLEKRWLVDVGFGDGFVYPLHLDVEDAQPQDRSAYQILRDDSRQTLFRHDPGKVAKAQYNFSLRSYQYPDFAEMCHYHQTSPQSHFTQGRVCSRLTSDGRVTLSKMRLIRTTKDGSREETHLGTDEEYLEALKNTSASSSIKRVAGRLLGFSRGDKGTRKPGRVVTMIARNGPRN